MAVFFNKKDSMKILALETATPSISFALVQNDNLLAEANYLADRNHINQLAFWLDNFLKQASCKVETIDFFACDIGPGYFTSLRVGIATIQGLSLSLEKPIIPVTSLEILAEQTQQIENKIVLIHSTQDTFFYTIYLSNICQHIPKVATISSILEKNLCIKNWVSCHDSIVQNELKKLNNTSDIKIIPALLNAHFITECCKRKLSIKTNLPSNILEHPWELQPLYLRLSRAEENLSSH